MNSDVFELFKSAGIVILVLFIIFCIYMYLRQDKIIYVPDVGGMKYPEDNPAPFQNPSQMNLKYKNAEIKTKDNETLQGWLVYGEKKPNKTLIYYHENAGNIGVRMAFFKYVVEELGINILTVGYRGFGRSTGTPSEQGLKLDGEAIANWVFDPQNKVAEEFIDKENVFLYGRSLGGAVLVHVATSVSLPLKGVIIENTFTTMGDLCDLLYPSIKPVRKYLLKNIWDTQSIIGKIKYPILFLRSEKDELIPKWQMDALYNLSTSTKFKDVYVIKNGTHNEGYIYDKVGFKNAILDFIDNISVGKEKGDSRMDESLFSKAETIDDTESKKDK